MLRVLGSLCIAAVLALALVGCGSSDGGDPTRDSRLVGVWQITMATEVGTVLPLADAMGWDEGTTRETAEFLADGTVVLRAYDGDTQVGTETGAWTAQDNVGTLTFDNDGDVETVPFTYTIFPTTGAAWLLDIAVATEATTFTRGTRAAGGTLTLRWVKVATPTDHDAVLVGTWQVLNAVVDNAAVPLATYFDFPPEADTMTVQFLADGTAVSRVQASDEVVGAETGAWATGGPTVLLTMGDMVVRGFWENFNVFSRTAAEARFTFADEEGRTVQMSLIPWGTGGGSAALVGTWQAATATVNGEAVSLPDFFGWENPDIDGMTLQFWADGTVESKELDGSTPVWTGFGTWAASGANLTLHFGEDTIPGTFTISGNTLTFSLEEDGDEIVLTFTRL